MRHTTFARSVLVLCRARARASPRRPPSCTAGRAGPSASRSKCRAARSSGVPGKHAGITAFRGVPFAAPPVGNRRWQAPQPPGTLDGRAEGRGIRAELHPVDRAGAQALDVRVHDARRDQRRLPLRQHLDAGQVTVGKAARLRLHLRRREHRGLRHGAGLRRRRARLEGTGRRQLQLPRRRARVPRRIRSCPRKRPITRPATTDCSTRSPP